MTINAEGKILIATPKIGGQFFHHTIIYVHQDDETGAVGVMLNVPMDEETSNRWIEELNWHSPTRIHHGGPVDRRLGFVIHSNDYAQHTSTPLNDQLTFTRGKSIINDINRGIGPNKYQLMTGYCSWAPHQLSIEIDSGLWIVTDFDIDYFFQDFDREQGWKFSINLAAENITKNFLDKVDTV